MSFQTKEVIVVPYDPQWPIQFNTLKSFLELRLVGLAQAIEHVGSTSVPFLAAKPIIDCDVVIRRGELARVEQCLECFGFHNRGDLGIPERYAFAGPDLGFRYHLYIVYPDSRPYLEHIALRDMLLKHPEMRDEYATLKIKLSSLHRFDIDAYIEGKTALIQRILALANTSEPK